MITSADSNARSPSSIARSITRARVGHDGRERPTEPQLCRGRGSDRRRRHLVAEHRDVVRAGRRGVPVPQLGPRRRRYPTSAVPTGTTGTTCASSASRDSVRPHLHPHRVEGQLVEILSQRPDPDLRPVDRDGRAVVGGDQVGRPQVAVGQGGWRGLHDAQQLLPGRPHRGGAGSQRRQRGEPLVCPADVVVDQDVVGDRDVGPAAQPLAGQPRAWLGSSLRPVAYAAWVVARSKAAASKSSSSQAVPGVPATSSIQIGTRPRTARWSGRCVAPAAAGQGVQQPRRRRAIRASSSCDATGRRPPPTAAGPSSSPRRTTFTTRESPSARIRHTPPVTECSRSCGSMALTEYDVTGRPKAACSSASSSLGGARRRAVPRSHRHSSSSLSPPLGPAGAVAAARAGRRTVGRRCARRPLARARSAGRPAPGTGEHHWPSSSTSRAPGSASQARIRSISSAPAVASGPGPGSRPRRRRPAHRCRAAGRRPAARRMTRPAGRGGRRTGPSRR